MSLPLVFSIMGMTVALLIGVMRGFPGPDGDISSSAVDESYSVESVHAVSGLMSNKFESLINELISFQKDPDYDRAEADRLQMVDLGTSALEQLSSFESRLRVKLGNLSSPSEDLDAETVQ